MLQEADTASSSDAGGAGDAEGAATPVVMIRAQFRLPGNMKLTEKFSTSEEVIALVRTVAKQVSDAPVNVDSPPRSCLKYHESVVLYFASVRNCLCCVCSTIDPGGGRGEEV